MNSVTSFLQNLFDPIIGVLGFVLQYFHALGAPWWLSIAITTVIVRTLLFPLTIKQVRSMRAMQDLKPEMDKVRAKYRDNRQKQQEEMMNLYRERGVNPLGGCLPVLVQMPVFIGIYYVIRQFGGYNGVEGTIPSFTTGGILWFENLSVRDPYLILPVVSALTMLAATEITSKNVEPQQRWLMRILPLGITVFLWRFPAGLFVYWITSNAVTLVQNYVIYNHGPGVKSPVGPTDNNRRNGSPGSAPQGSANRTNGESDARESRQTVDGAATPSTRAAKRRRRKRKK